MSALLLSPNMCISVLSSFLALIVPSCLSSDLQDLEPIVQQLKALEPRSLDPALVRQTLSEAQAIAKVYPSSPLSGEVHYLVARTYLSIGDSQAALGAAHSALEVGSLNTQFWTAKFLAMEMPETEVRLDGASALLAVYNELARLQPQSETIQSLGGAEELFVTRVMDLQHLARQWLDSGRSDLALSFAEQSVRLASGRRNDVYGSAARTLAETQFTMGQFEDAQATLDEVWELYPEAFGTRIDYVLQRLDYSGMKDGDYLVELERLFTDDIMLSKLSASDKGRSLAYLGNQFWAHGRRSRSEEFYAKAADYYNMLYKVGSPLEAPDVLPKSLHNVVLDRLCASESLARVGRLNRATAVLDGLWDLLSEEEIRNLIDPGIIRNLQRAVALHWALRRAIQDGDSHISIGDLFFDRTVIKTDKLGKKSEYSQPARYREISVADIIKTMRGEQPRTVEGWNVSLDSSLSGRKLLRQHGVDSPKTTSEDPSSPPFRILSIIALIGSVCMLFLLRRFYKHV